MDSFTDEVIEKWGKTKAYARFAEKTKHYSKEHFTDVQAGLENIFRDFAKLMLSGAAADSAAAQALVKTLQEYITEHYYTCTDDILKGLGQMYVADERFKNTINKHAPGTAEYASKAIALYTK
ncbi:MAG: TipAS antibiotic-recognition domain-containing protein [Clostridia bacterium]|nr:TipAS antibiotic-recognition domain-containing protein [Clostridia bacterium]